MLTDLKVFNKTQAMEYLGIKRALLEAELAAGHIPYKKGGKNNRSWLIPKWALDQWLKDTNNFIGSSNVVTSGTPIYHSPQQPASAYSLDALVAQATEQRLSRSCCKKSANCSRRLR